MTERGHTGPITDACADGEVAPIPAVRWAAGETAGGDPHSSHSPSHSITSSARARIAGGTVRPSGLGGLEIDHQLEFGGPFDRQIGRNSGSSLFGHIAEKTHHIVVISSVSPPVRIFIGARLSLV